MSTGYYYKRNGKELLTIGKPGYAGTDDALLAQIEEEFLRELPKRKISGRAVLVPGEEARLRVTAPALSENEEPVTVEAAGDLVQAALKRPMQAQEIESRLRKTGDSLFAFETLEVDTDGNVFLDDELITKMPMYKRARLGISYLPQEPSVFRKLTVEENIWSILETRQDLSDKEKKEQLEELIEEFSIQKIRKQQAYTLSGGERRRTEIARSLAIQPKFLLLDEPFAGIDPIAVADIKKLIKLLSKKGIGILITDHNVRDTLEITDRAIIISSGQIVIQGNKQEILNSEIAREIYLGTDFSM